MTANQTAMTANRHSATLSPSRPMRQGQARLSLALLAVERMLLDERPPVRNQLEAELGRSLVRQLDRLLEQEGRLLAARPGHLREAA